ncbi:MAG: thioredoxin family protein [Pseudomonadota bacterium]
MRLPGALVLVLMLLPADAGAAFYRCTVNGSVVYQDTPCADGSGAFTPKPITSMSGSKGGASAGKAATGSAAGGAYNSDKWHFGMPGYELALSESKRTGTPMLVYFYASWCGYCKRVERDVFPDAKVMAQLRRFIKVKIDTEQSNDTNALFRSLGGSGIPFALTGSGGSKLQRISFGNYRPDSLVSELDRVLKAKRR